MRARTILTLLAVGLAASVSLYGQETSSLPTLTAAEAKDHIGEKARVCGRVADTWDFSWLAESRGGEPGDQPAGLTLDKPIDQQGFRVSFRVSDWERLFGEPGVKHPEVKYKGKTICVTGRITCYQGVLNIVFPDQIEIPEVQEEEQAEEQAEEGSPTAKPKPGETLSLVGKLTAEGVECPAFRDDDNTLYTLMGDLKSWLKAGDRVCVTGTVVEVSTCMQGTTLKLTSIH